MELSKVSKIQGLFKRVHLSLICAFYYLCLSLAVLSISACGGGGHSEESKVISVELFGDSILTAPGILTKPSVRLKELNPSWDIYDNGYSGLALTSLVNGLSTPEHNIKKFSEVVLKGCYVVISAGGNDALGLLDAGEFRSNLLSAVSHVEAQKRIPVLTGIVDIPLSEFATQERLDRRNQFNDITLEVARVKGLEHAGWGEDKEGNSETIDGIHRTQKTSDRLAFLLSETIKRASSGSFCLPD